MLSQMMCNEVIWVESMIIPNANDSENRIVSKRRPSQVLSKDPSVHRESGGRFITKYIKSRHGT